MALGSFADVGFRGSGSAWQRLRRGCTSNPKLGMLTAWLEEGLLLWKILGVQGVGFRVWGTGFGGVECRVRVWGVGVGH